MTNPSSPSPSDEPSVWDYIVGKIKSRKENSSDPVLQNRDETPNQAVRIPWWTFGAVAFALIAQFLLEPSPSRTPWPGVVLYIGAFGCLLVAIFSDEWQLPDLRPDDEGELKTVFRIDFFLVGFLLAIFAFILFGSGQFNGLNTPLWILAIIFSFLSVWQRKPHGKLRIQTLYENFSKKGITIRITRWTVVVLAVISVILFFNFFRLDSVPPEMVSDQAEKLLDINDILNGSRAVYFPRNTGREVLHFYLTAAYVRLFNLDVNFLNLKVVAVLANLLTLFFIYLLGKEIGNKWVGLSAVLFAGMAYWPLLFSRLALRIPYYPLFVAPVMYFLVRGLRRQNINDILWTGLFLGLGLHGYTPFRIVPIFVVFGILIFIFHKASRKKRLPAIFALIVIAFVSLLVFLPLLRYWLANPDLFGYRAFSRLTGMEVGFQKSPILIFLENFWKASVMFFWDNGTIWAHSIPNRPALELVTGALYFLGITGLIVRYIRKHRWQDLFLLVSIPMLLMPSILSLAYPGENPCLNRTAGAIVPVFLIVGLAFETLIRTIRTHLSPRHGRMVAVLIAVVMVMWSGVNNYKLVFDQYYAIYQASSWNTSEIGRSAALFIESIGSPENTFVVGYPHWVDSRLVAINAGYTGWDFAIMPDEIPATENDPKAKMFFLNIDDNENMALLKTLFPSGVLWQFDSAVAYKDFVIFFVPPSQGETP